VHYNPKTVNIYVLSVHVYIVHVLSQILKGVPHTRNCSRKLQSVKLPCLCCYSSTTIDFNFLLHASNIHLHFDANELADTDHCIVSAVKRRRLCTLQCRPTAIPSLTFHPMIGAVVVEPPPVIGRGSGPISSAVWLRSYVFYHSRQL